MISAEDLTFRLISQLPSSPDSGESSYKIRPSRPNKCGCVYLCSPPIHTTSLPPSICFRYNIFASRIECIQANPEKSLRIIGFEDVKSFPSPIFQLSCSFDARLLVVICMDGTLTCYNVLLQSDFNNIDGFDEVSVIFQKRWMINIYTTDEERYQLSMKNHPIRTLSFAPSSYRLLLVDAVNRNVFIMNAQIHSDSTTGIVIKQSDWLNLLESSCAIGAAAWCPLHTSSSEGAVDQIAIGSDDGKTIAVLDILENFSKSEYKTSLRLHSKLSIPTNEDSWSEDDWVCTYLHWYDKDELVVGLSRILGSSKIRDSPSCIDDYDDDEDDDVIHEAELLICNLSSSQWTDMKEVVPFFGVPKRGRHSFYSIHLNLEGLCLLLVAINVSNDFGILCKAESAVWSLWDLQEDNKPMMPTTDDDEFTFPTGLIPITFSEKIGFAVHSTNGITLSFLPQHDDDRKARFLLPRFGLHDTVGIHTLKCDPLISKDKINMARKEKSTESAPLNEVNKLFFQAPTLLMSTGFASSQQISTQVWNKKAESVVSPSFGLSSALQGSFRLGSSNGDCIEKGVTMPQSAIANAPFGTTFTTSTLFGAGLAQPSIGGFSTLAKMSATSDTVGFADSSKTVLPFMNEFHESNDTKASLNETPSLSENHSIGVECVKSNCVASAKSPTFYSKHEYVDTRAILPNLSKSDDSIQQNNEKPDIDNRAGKAFDTVDEMKTGTISMDQFEHLLDQIGEGFYGEELEIQKRKVDPRNTGSITRGDFIIYYHTLLSGGPITDQDDASIDSEEQAEQQEEREKAERIFSSIARSDSECIRKEDFGNLIEALGSVYCEEEHRRTIKALSRSDGMIRKNEFLTWYVKWLFDGDNESIEEASSSDDANGGDHDASETTLNSITSVNVGWGDTFTSVVTKWKCNVCMVSNEVSLSKCAACEAIRPGSVEDKSHSAPKPDGLLDQTSLLGSVKAVGSGTKTSFIFSAAHSEMTITPPDLSTGNYRPDLDKSMPTFYTSFQPTSATISGGFVFQPTKMISEANCSFNGTVNATKTTSFTSISEQSDKPKIGPLHNEKVSDIFPSINNKKLNPLPREAASEMIHLSTSKSSAYPLMSFPAPTPFSSGSGTNAPISTSLAPFETSANLPMSDAAPTPFSLGSETKTQTSTSLAPSTTVPISASKSSAYPPMSVAAPTPSGTKPHTSTSLAPSTTVPVSASKSSAYPPMSVVAPTPFGGSGTKASTSTSLAPSTTVPMSTSKSSAYPPMSVAAPTPFSGSGTKAPTSTSFGLFEAVPVSASKSMSVAAPTPFGGSGTKAPTSNSFSLSEAVPMSTSKSSANPPKSVATLTPSTPIISTSNNHSSAYPPFSIAAPTPLTQKYYASSAYEAQFWSLVHDLEQVMSRLHNELSASPRMAILEKDLLILSDKRENLRWILEKIEGDFDEWSYQIQITLGVNDDVSRRIQETQQLSNFFGNDKSSSKSNFDIRRQPLDAESEKQKRNLLSRALSTQMKLRNTQHMIQLLDGILPNVSDDNLQRPIAYISRVVTGGNILLFKTLKANYDRTYQLDSLVSDIRRDAQSINSLNRKGTESGHMTSPQSTFFFSANLSPRQMSESLSSTVHGIPFRTQDDASFAEQDMGRRTVTEACRQWNEASFTPVKRVLYRWNRVSKSNSTVVKQTQKAAYTRHANIMTTVCDSGTNMDIFGKPKLSVRAGWKSDDTMDQTKLVSLKFGFPNAVREVDVVNAQKQSLKSFGLTYEKVVANQEVKHRGELDSRLQVKRFPSRDPLNSVSELQAIKDVGPDKGGDSKSISTSVSVVNNGMSRLSSSALQKSVLDLKALSDGLSHVSSTSFGETFPSDPIVIGTEFKNHSLTFGAKSEPHIEPPVSAQHNSKSGNVSQVITSSNGDTNKNDSKPFPLLQSEQNQSSSSMQLEQSNLSSSLITSNSTFASSSLLNPSTTLPTSIKKLDSDLKTASTLPSTNQMSYGNTPREILTNVFRKYNPSKLGEIDKVLTKYAGQEELMIRNLGKKYNIQASTLGINDASSVSGSSSLGLGTSGSGFYDTGLNLSQGFGLSANTPASSGGFGSRAQMGHSVTGFGSSTSGLPGTSGFVGSSFGGGNPNTSMSFASFANTASNTPPAFGTSTPFGAPRR